MYVADEAHPIDGVSEAVAVLDRIARDERFCADDGCFHKFPFGVWFRGHARKGLRLKPHVFRRHLRVTDQEKGAWDETNVYEHLKLRVPAHEQTYHSAFEWLCLMQHYAVPTRLLDWSESILPALYFAAKEFPERDGEIIVLNAHRLNARIKPRPTISTPDDYRVVVRAEMALTRSSRTLRLNKRLLDATKEAPADERPPTEDATPAAVGAWLKKFVRPVAVFPRWLNSRMSLQSSVFTLHGGKRYVPVMRSRYEGELLPDEVSLETIDRHERANGTPLLKRFIIPKKRKPAIMLDLFRLGVHEGTLFPEIDRQAVYLQQCWWYRDAGPLDPSYLSS